MVTTSLEPGCMIGPNIRLAHKLGEGGMGSVWVADHLTLKTQVAVKFMSEAVARNEAAMARFTDEARAAAQIKSRHVVQILDSGVTAWGVAFIVMELLLGEDLGARLDRVRRLSVEEMAEVVEHTCKALAQAHRHGIVHRDIKPENIFFTQSDGDVVIKILDFGIAKRQGDDSFSATSTGSMMGTPLYMSPEQVLSSKHVHHASDLWSLGVVAYHALTGILPFDGETVGAICVAINDGKFKPVSSLRADVPAGIDAWIERALAHDPGSRFESAKQMSDSLARLLGRSRGSIPSLEPSAARTMAPDPALPLDRRPNLLIVATAAAFGIAAFAIVLAVARTPATPAAGVVVQPTPPATTASLEALPPPSEVPGEAPSASPVPEAAAPRTVPVQSLPIVKPAAPATRRKNRGF
jgi:eukaryotic-like serine/threonine-protein kinase